MSDFPTTFRMMRNQFGLYEISANKGWKKIPDFLRPRPNVENVGLARGTSIGNFHEPYIEQRSFGREHLIVDKSEIRKTVFEILRRGCTLIEERW